MTVKTERFFIATKGFNDVIDLTSKIEGLISSIENDGIININILSSTASIILIENESGIVNDICKIMENIVPINKVYQHDSIWHDGNAFAHLKSAILGNNLTINFAQKKLILNPHQKIVMIDFDNKATFKKEISANIIY